MEIELLKEHILEENLIPVVLEKLGCHHISHKDGYYTCGNPDGDNHQAVCVYENSYLTTVNYTRDINNGKSADLISLVEFYKNESFPYAIKWICDALEIDYYSEFDEDLPESIRITKMLLNMQTDDSVDTDDDTPLKPISEKILSYYKCYVNDMFKEDGISYETQRIFEVGYDEVSNRITIPIRDDINNLVGVKARYFYRKVPDDELKYLYIEKCSRSKILYGLNKTIQYIQQKGRVFVVEAEKGVMQLYDAGFYECVATCGKKISKEQINKLTRLCVPIYFVFDKDVEVEELQSIADKFIDETEIYALVDDKNILDEKQSPTDSIEKFKQLLDTGIYKLK